MTLSFECNNLIKDCKWSTSASSMHDLMRKINTHVEYKHDIEEMSQVQKNQLKAHIKNG